MVDVELDVLDELLVLVDVEELVVDVGMLVDVEDVVLDVLLVVPTGSVVEVVGGGG